MIKNYLLGTVFIFGVLLLPSSIKADSYKLLAPDTDNGTGNTKIYRDTSGNMTFDDANNAPVTLSTILSGGASPVSIMTSQQLPRWRTALAKARDGQSDARILFIGDSTTWGAGSTGYPGLPWLGSMPTRVAQLNTSSSLPVTVGLGIPPTALVASVDNRWTVGTGWAIAARGFGSNACWQIISSTTTLGYNASAGGTNITADSFWIYYLGGPGVGTLSAWATGGSTVTVNAGSLASYVYRSSVTASGVATTNTVTISASGIIQIIGVEPFLSGTKQVLVGNAGVGGSLSTQWFSSAASGALPAIKTFAPDLTVISLGINDANSGVTNANFYSNIQAIISTATLTGDVLLVTMPPLRMRHTQHLNLGMSPNTTHLRRQIIFLSLMSLRG